MSNENIYHFVESPEECVARASMRRRREASDKAWRELTPFVRSITKRSDFDLGFGLGWISRKQAEYAAQYNRR